MPYVVSAVTVMCVLLFVCDVSVLKECKGDGNPGVGNGAVVRSGVTVYKGGTRGVGMCIQCSIMLHLIDICFISCICLWLISKIQTCWRVLVEPGLVSTSPALMRSSASHPSGQHDRLAQKNGKLLGRVVSAQFVQRIVIESAGVCCVVWSHKSGIHPSPCHTLTAASAASAASAATTTQEYIVYMNKAEYKIKVRIVDAITCFPPSLNIRRLSNVQRCVRNVHINRSTLFSYATPHSHVCLFLPLFLALSVCGL